MSDQGDEIQMDHPFVEKFKLCFGATSLCTKLDGKWAVVTQQTRPNVRYTIREEIKAIHRDEGAVQTAENGSRLAHITPSEFRTSSDHFKKRGRINESIEI